MKIFDRENPGILPLPSWARKLIICLVVPGLTFVTFSESYGVSPENIMSKTKIQAVSNRKLVPATVSENCSDPNVSNIISSPDPIVVTQTVPSCDIKTGLADAQQTADIMIAVITPSQAHGKVDSLSANYTSDVARPTLAGMTVHLESSPEISATAPYDFTVLAQSFSNAGQPRYMLQVQQISSQGKGEKYLEVTNNSTSSEIAITDTTAETSYVITTAGTTNIEIFESSHLTDVHNLSLEFGASFPTVFLNDKVVIKIDSIDLINHEISGTITNPDTGLQIKFTGKSDTESILPEQITYILQATNFQFLPVIQK